MSKLLLLIVRYLTILIRISLFTTYIKLYDMDIVNKYFYALYISNKR